MIREKRTRSGPMLEVDFFPVFDNGNKMPTRAPKTKPSTEAQIRYNQLMAEKKLIRLINANFDTTDYFMHPTYDTAYAPQDEAVARRDIVNYLRRVKTKRASLLKSLQSDMLEARKDLERSPKSKFLLSVIDKLKKSIDKLKRPFKYAYRIEKQVYKSGPYAGCCNWHFHLFLTGGLDSKTLEEMWPKGMRTNCCRYQPDKFGPEAAGKYMCKDPNGVKRFSYSRNLVKPVLVIKDGKVSKNAVSKMAAQRVDDKAYWENRYKGYTFVRCYNRYNEYNGHWYVSVIMYKNGDAPPKWEAPDWITEDYQCTA